MSWKRRTGYYLVSLAVLILLYTVIYHWANATYEGASHSFLQSFQFVVETFTATGYGSHAPWETPVMNLLVVVMDLTGVALIFLALPIMLFPLFEEAVSTTPPDEVDGITDHVVICAFSPRIRMWLDELETLDIPAVVIEPDRDLAVELVEAGITVIHGDPDSAETLQKANITDARALVADVDDSTNATILLTAADLAPDVQRITFVEDPSMADYHRYAGADHVFSPRQLIGESIAKKITTSVSTEVGDAVEIEEDFEIVELPVQTGSDLTGRTIAESGIRERTGANVIGAWFRGEFLTPPPPDSRIDDQTIVLVAGHEDQVEQLKAMTLSDERQRRPGKVIIAGYGEVGSTVERELAGADLECITLDKDDRDDVDIVGEVTDESVLRAAGIQEASTVFLALADDAMTVFATLVIRNLDPSVEIIARADQTENVTKLYQAGADYVLALATVSGRMLASTILGGDVISLDHQVEVVRFDAAALAGETLAGADIRARTGCSVIAIERNGTVYTDLDPDFEIHRDDSVVVAGPDDAITQFAAMFE
jgi:Trk K+ transport system NAD-binding subunit